MPRLPLQTLETAPEASRKALEKLKAKFGTIGNLQGHLATSPAALNAYMAMKHELAKHATLSPAVQEAIALAVGAVNDCAYCQSAHTWAGIRAGLTEEQTVMIRKGEAPWDAKLSALITVVREAAENKGYVSDEAWQRAVDAGWTDEELTEAGAHLVANLFTNYFNHYAGTELGALKPAPGLAVHA